MNINTYVFNIIKSIKENGIEELKRYNKEFDDYDGEIYLSNEELNSDEKIEPKIAKNIDEVIMRIEDFHARQKYIDIQYQKNNSYYSLNVVPIEKIGIYIPKDLVSTLIMTAVPAKLSNVSSITVCTPPCNYELFPYIIYICKKLGIKNIYKIGGIQAITAMTYGIGIEKVDKIFGPGNKYVNEAKRQVFGDVGIDSLAGPSEICIIADDSARKEYVYNDLLSQIEHGNDSKAYLLTNSKDIYEYCNKERIERYFLNNIMDSINIVNEIAPEHLQIMTEYNDKIASRIKNAGAIYKGNFTPVPSADYFLGTNHVLPTGKTARFTSMLTLFDFIKFVPVCSLSKEEFYNNRELGMNLAKLEKMNQHSKSLEVR